MDYSKMIIDETYNKGTITKTTAVKEGNGIAIRLLLTHTTEKGYNYIHLKHINHKQIK